VAPPWRHLVWFSSKIMWKACGFDIMRGEHRKAKESFFELLWALFLWYSLQSSRDCLYRQQFLWWMIKQLSNIRTDEINDSGGFFQLVRIYANKLRPLVGFCTIFLALFKLTPRVFDLIGIYFRHVHNKNFFLWIVWLFYLAKIWFHTINCLPLNSHEFEFLERQVLTR
jgi:hypothetical protein